MIIRRARLEDYKGLLEVYAELDDIHLQHHPDLFKKPEANSRTLSYVEDLILAKYKEIFVAEEEGRILGLAECVVMKSSDFPVVKKRQWVQLDNIAVRRDSQQHHIGTLLLAQVTQWARSMNISRIELKVYTFNTNAIQFYTNKGFSEVAQVMALNLED